MGFQIYLYWLFTDNSKKINPCMMLTLNNDFLMIHVLWCIVYEACKVECSQINWKIFNASSLIFCLQFRFVFEMIIRVRFCRKKILDASNPKEMEEAGKHGLAILGGETPLWKLICLRLIFKLIIYFKSIICWRKLYE